MAGAQGIDGIFIADSVPPKGDKSGIRCCLKAAKNSLHFVSEIPFRFKPDGECQISSLATELREYEIQRASSLSFGTVECPVMLLIMGATFTSPALCNEAKHQE